MSCWRWLRKNFWKKYWCGAMKTDEKWSFCFTAKQHMTLSIINNHFRIFCMCVLLQVWYCWSRHYRLFQGGDCRREKTWQSGDHSLYVFSNLIFSMHTTHVSLSVPVTKAKWGDAIKESTCGVAFHGGARRNSAHGRFQYNINYKSDWYFVFIIYVPLIIQSIQVVFFFEIG